jgi:Tfp pilus assembly protein PilV
LFAFLLASVGVIGRPALAAPAVHHRAATAAQVQEQEQKTADGMQAMADAVARVAPQYADAARAACTAATGKVNPDEGAFLASFKKALPGVDKTSWGKIIACGSKGFKAYKACMSWVDDPKWCGAFAGIVIGICLNHPRS